MSSAKDATEFFNFLIEKSSMNLENVDSNETLTQQWVSSSSDEYATCEDSALLLEIQSNRSKLSNKSHFEMFQTNAYPVESNEQTSLIEIAPDLIPCADARSYAVPITSEEYKNSAELLPFVEGVRFEACQTGGYIRNQREESKIDDPGQSNVELIKVINELLTMVEADCKNSVINETRRSKVIQNDETIALKNLAKVSNLIPQFERCQIVDETAKTKIGKTSTISPKTLDIRKPVAEKTSPSNSLTLPDVCKGLNEMGIEKNLQQDTVNAFPEKLQSEINQMSGRFVDSKETITGVTTRNIESIFDDDCEIILDYKEFEKGVNVNDTIWQVAYSHEKHEFPNIHEYSKALSRQYEETRSQIQTIVEPAVESKKNSTDEIDLEFYKSPQPITSLDKKTEFITESHVTLSNSNMGKSINTEVVEDENNPESIFILAGEEIKLKGLVEQKFVHHKISSGIITESEEMFVPDKIKSLEDERIAELVEEKLDQNEKLSEIIQAKVRKPGSSKVKFDLHEVPSKIDYANKEAAKFFLTESSDPEIGHMSETEDIPKDIGKKLDYINFSTSPDKISYINEVAKDVMKVSLEIPTNETIKSALSSKTKNIVKEISELPKHSTPAKSPICVESATDLKAHTNQTLSEELSLKATSSQVVEVKNSKRINPGNKQTVVKGKMEKNTKKDEKNVISCRQKTTLPQNKAAKFPLIDIRKVGSKTSEPKIVSGKIVKSIVTQAKVPASFGQSDSRKFESKPSHRYEAFGRLPLAKCPPRELKPAVKTFPAKSGLSNGNPPSKTNERQKPLKSSILRTFPKQAIVAKVCSSSTATVSSKTPANENSATASSSSTKISNSTVIRNRQRNFPEKITTKDPKDTKSEKPKWR